MSETIATLAVTVYTFLLPVGWIVVAIAVFVFTPMAFFRATRGPAGVGLVMASYLFGLITWLLGAAVTFATYGFLGFIIGIFLFGIGVVPIGIFAAFVTLKLPSLGITLIVMIGVVWVARLVGVGLAENA